VKTSWVRRSTAGLAVSLVVSLAAINQVTHQATADPTPIANWSLDTTEVSIASGGDVYVTIDDPIIHDTRYVPVDKLTFPGKRHQTIDTGIVVQDHLPAIDKAGFNVQAWVSRQVGSGYLFSTNGVFTYAESGTKILLPRYGVFYGYSSLVPRDSNFSAIRTVLSAGTNIDFPSTAQTTQTNIPLPFTGFFSATLSNPSGVSFIEERDITPIGASSPTQALTTNIGKDPSFLGGTTLLVGGVGGPCLSATSCESVWTTDGLYKTDSSIYHRYSASMFEGDVTSFKIFGNTDGTSATNNTLIFDGIPAYDQVTGYCGLYDTLSAQFKTAEAGSEALVTCASQTPTISVASMSDSPSLVFDYIENPAQCSSTQTPVINPCVTSVDGVLRLALPPLPDGWAAGAHPFRLTISYGDAQRIIDFTLFYVGPVPPGQLSIRKRAWKDVPVGMPYAAILGGGFTELLDGAVIPLDTDVTFTFTVLYAVAPDSGGDYTGRSGLKDVVVTNGSVQVCTLDVDVNVPQGCTMRPSSLG